MQQNKVNSLIKWWVTPKLPYQDVYGLPLLKEKGVLSLINYRIIQWFSHPIKRRAARQYLRLLQHFTDIKVIGITGSVGKSTTSQMINSILKQNGSVVCTLPNVDSVYNIPNTILRCQPETKYLILEMSVEYPGEMDFYLWLAKPDIGVITNVFPSHTEFLGDVNGVLKEKGKLLLALSKSGKAVLNSDDARLADFAGKIKAKVVRFNGKGDIIIQNSSAATRVAETLGVGPETVKKGLGSYEMPRHRLEIVKLKSGATILDDTYNSNPG